MKLVSTISEITALKTLCSDNIVVAGTLLGAVEKSYFHNSFSREVYSRILKLQESSGSMPSWSDILEDPAIKEETRNKIKDYDTKKIRTADQARELSNTLNKYRQLRGVFKLAEDSVLTLKKQKVDIEDLLQEVAETIGKLRQTKDNNYSVTTFGKGNNSTDIVKKLLLVESSNFVPTGFSSFDVENGGIGRGNLMVLGGSSGAGKSALAAQLGLNWSDMGLKVSMASLEMTAEEMTARIMANAAELDVRKIIFRKLSTAEKKVYVEAYKKLVNKKKETGGSFSVFKPKTDMSIEDIMASISPSSPDAIIIDYISLLRGVDGDDSWQKLGAVARYCKMYAETNNIIVVMLCQVSDEGKIRYAQAIKEHANYAWTFVATKTTRENEILNVEQIKARNGRLFDFSLRARLDVMRIYDMDSNERLPTIKEEKAKSKKSKYVSDLTEDKDDE